MDTAGLDAVLIILSSFGGISLVVWTAMKAKIARIKAEREVPQILAAPQESLVIAEMKALKQQVAEIHSTSHQFDISFDEALSRMESRVGRLEAKSAVVASTTDTTSGLTW